MTDDSSHDEEPESVRLRQLLRTYLIHTREVPNGKDFVFSGPPQLLHDLLRRLVLSEQARWGELLRLDFTDVGPFYLLRVIGGPSEQAEIASFLGVGDEEAAR